MIKKRTPNPEKKKIFGKIIRGSRKRRGLTQEKVAELMNCFARWIIQIEEGESCPNVMDTILLMKILRLLPDEVAEEVRWSVPLLTDRT